MVFMKRDIASPARSDDSNMKTSFAPAIPAVRCWRPFYWTLSLLASACIAVSAQATVTKTVFSPGPIEIKLAPIPGKDALYPLIGLFAAVASTHILRRRRMAQLEAIGIVDR
jgi:hypothetical protein